LKFNERYQQIHAQGYPDLCHHCIFTRANKRFNFPVLLDPLKKQFDLSSGLINIGNAFSGQLEIIGQKHIMLTTLSISVTDAA
jgi:hypothetical protein